MSWFNTYESVEGDALTRKVVTTVDLSKLPLADWTLEELGRRLAVLYPKVDGYGYLTADAEVIAETRALMTEIGDRGYDPISNLRYNERFSGWGWLNWFDKKED